MDKYLECTKKIIKKYSFTFENNIKIDNINPQSIYKSNNPNIIQIFDLKKDKTHLFNICSNKIKETLDGKPILSHSSNFKLIKEDNNTFNLYSLKNNKIVFKGYNIQNIFQYNNKIYFISFDKKLSLWNFHTFEQPDSLNTNVMSEINSISLTMIGVDNLFAWFRNANIIYKYNIDKGLVFHITLNDKLFNFIGKSLIYDNKLYISNKISNCISVFNI